ncbi:hypothetical protein C2S51_037703 [Perilla frutescens var. frutescens]|nr:hypothetical protein C2S51_037703 [Perilla frutescens var. frutescens]
MCLKAHVTEKSPATTSTAVEVVLQPPVQPSTTEGDDEVKEDDIHLSLKMKAITATLAKGKKKVIHRPFVADPAEKEVIQSSSSESAEKIPVPQQKKLIVSAQYDPFSRSPVKKKTPRKKAFTAVVQLVPRTPMTRSRASATPPSTSVSTKKRKAIASTGPSKKAKKAAKSIHEPEDLHSYSSEHESEAHKKIVSVPGTYRQSIFHSSKHAELWEKVKQRSMISEKKMDMDTLLATGVYTLLEQAGLLGTVQKVQEFVPKKVFVRGDMVQFSPNLINEFLGCTSEGEFQEIDDWGMVAAELTQIIYTKWPSHPQTIPTSKLTHKYGALFRILIHNWLPTKHRAAIIGSVESTMVKGPLCYPSLIYIIIKQQKENVSSKKDKITPLHKPLVIKVAPEIRDPHLCLQFKQFMSSKKGVDDNVEESSPKSVVLRFLEKSLEFHARLISEHTSKKMKIQEMIVDLSSGEKFASPAIDVPENVHNLHKLASTAKAAAQKKSTPAPKQAPTTEQAKEAETVHEETTEEDHEEGEARMIMKKRLKRLLMMEKRLSMMMLRQVLKKKDLKEIMMPKTLTNLSSF